MNNFKDRLDEYAQYAEAVIAKELEAVKDTDAPELLTEAMCYSVAAGGKRLRPVLMYSFYRLFKGEGKAVEYFMTAIEMLHTYSLVHDDLPAIDNDDYRRGMYSTHRKYGEAVGILAGDGLLHQAYETALKAFKTQDSMDRIIKALFVFGKSTGINGMLGGQSADVFNTGNNISDELMYYIYEKKTGALIEGSMMIGAALAGAGEEELNSIRKAGADIGMAFQIRDDILDVYGDEAVLGKPVNSDEQNGKKTYLTVNGMDKSLLDVEEYTDRAVKLLDTIGCDDEEREFLKELFKYLTSRNK